MEVILLIPGMSWGRHATDEGFEVATDHLTWGEGRENYPIDGENRRSNCLTELGLSIVSKRYFLRDVFSAFVMSLQAPRPIPYPKLQRG